MKKLIFLLVLVCLSVNALLAEEPGKAIISKEQAIDIARKSLNRYMSFNGGKLATNEDGINTINATFHQTGHYNDWTPHPVIYKSKDFQDNTGFVAAAEKMAKEAKKADESGNGYWEVTFIPRNPQVPGGCTIRVDSKTGQSDGPMFLR